MNQKIIHKRSNVVADGIAKLPTADQLDYGELAINYADGCETITIKNSNNDSTTFRVYRCATNRVSALENKA